MRRRRSRCGPDGCSQRWRRPRRSSPCGLIEQEVYFVQADLEMHGFAVPVSAVMANDMIMFFETCTQCPGQSDLKCTFFVGLRFRHAGGCSLRQVGNAVKYFLRKRKRSCSI